jgi:hypothetical protein
MAFSYHSSDEGRELQVRARTKEDEDLAEALDEGGSSMSLTMFVMLLRFIFTIFLVARIWAKESWELSLAIALIAVAIEAQGVVLLKILRVFNEARKS